MCNPLSIKLGYINQLVWQLSQANQDCKAERFKNVGLQGDLDKFYEQRGLIGDYGPNDG